jgi:hypothetical protein
MSSGIRLPVSRIALIAPAAVGLLYPKIVPATLEFDRGTRHGRRTAFVTMMQIPILAGLKLTTAINAAPGRLSLPNGVLSEQHHRNSLYANDKTERSRCSDVCVNFRIICESFSAICELVIIDIGMMWVQLRPARVAQLAALRIS